MEALAALMATGSVSTAALMQDAAASSGGRTEAQDSRAMLIAATKSIMQNMGLAEGPSLLRPAQGGWGDARFRGTQDGALQRPHRFGRTQRDGGPQWHQFHVAPGGGAQRGARVATPLADTVGRRSGPLTVFLCPPTCGTLRGALT